MDFVKTGPVQFERIVVFHKVEHEYRIKNDSPWFIGLPFGFDDKEITL
jgi:hypothetical protein